MAERDYQLNQIDEAAEKVTRFKKIIVQLPTGGGKTYEFALLAQRYVRSTDKSVMICVDRKELMYQAAKTIKKTAKIDARLITAKTKKFQKGRVYIAMVESLVSRMNLFDNVGMIIIDECHVANFNKLHSLFLEELIIGFTATPISSSKKEPLNKYYNEIVVGPQISELIKYGYLAQNITRCPSERVDASKLAVDKMTGDYNEGIMAEEYRKPKHVLNVIEQYERFCLGKKTMVYNVNKDHSKQVNQAFQLMGYNSRHLDSDATDKEREECITWFRENEDAILNNVGLFTRGFDEPTIQRVIPNFSTLSPAKWMQCCGRGGRIIDEEFIRDYQHLYPYPLEIKYWFEIIDMGGNAVSGLGDWNDDRDWRRIFENPEIPSEGGVAPTKICPNCSGLIHAALSKCPLRKEDGEFCNWEFVKRKEAEKLDMEMVVVTQGINIEELIQKNNKKHIYYPFLKMGEEVVNKTFEKFKNPSETILQKAFIAYYDLCIEWYKETLANEDGNIKDITLSDYWIKRARNNFDSLVKLKQKNAIPYDYTEMTTPVIHYDYTCNGCEENVEAVDSEGFCYECQEENEKHTRSVRGY